MRRAMAVDGLVTYWTQDTDGLEQVLIEHAPSGATFYLLGLSRLAQIEGSSAEWFLGDGLGSVRQLVDDDGVVVLAQDYDPYGQVLAQEGTGSSGYGFTGEQVDPTGLVYLRARYFHPSLGRFVSVDPFPGYAALPASIHPYLYCLDDPVNAVDPSGLQGEPPSWLQRLGPIIFLLPELMASLERLESYLEQLENASDLGVCWDQEQELRIRPPDVVGVRVDGSAALAVLAALNPSVGAALAAATLEFPPLLLLEVTGLDLNVDLLLSLTDQETGEWKGPVYAVEHLDENFTVMVGVNGQFATGGASISAGPVWLWNVPNLEALEGFNLELGATFAVGAGMEVGFIFQPPATEGGPLVWGIHFPSVGGGGELSAFASAGWQWDAVDLLVDLLHDDTPLLGAAGWAHSETR